MFSNRKIPWIIRMLMLMVLIPVAFIFFGVGAIIEWIWERVRR